MKNKTKMYSEYCTGCGLCMSVKSIAYNIDDRGFIKPRLKNEDLAFCDKYCPANGKSLNLVTNDHIWGEVYDCSACWAADDVIRNKASSGGVLTALCIYLIENNIVDGIVQVKAEQSNQIKTTVWISRTKDDIISCSGSRYTISSPLMNIKDILDDDYKYAFVGKPCDVYAIRNYCSDNDKYKDKFKYYFSFFCAAMPSYNANKVLLDKLGTDEDNCEYLQYRGNGWPGMTIAKDKDGTKKNSMKYEDSWGKILGRDVKSFCKFCVDGIGLSADIVCGDAWYINEKGGADFRENEGRNVVFARNIKGKRLLDECVNDNNIIRNAYTLEELQKIQIFQYTRKNNLYSRLIGMKLLGKPIPNYNMSQLKQFENGIGTFSRIKIVLGTIKRIILRKI